MAVLKVESVEKLLGLLVVDLGQRLAHRKRRARILGHAVGLHLGIGAVDGVDFGAVARGAEGTVIVGPGL